MHIDLELTSRDGGLHGSASWLAHPEPATFDGVLELMALLEAATTTAEEAG